MSSPFTLLCEKLLVRFAIRGDRNISSSPSLCLYQFAGANGQMDPRCSTMQADIPPLQSIAVDWP